MQENNIIRANGLGNQFIIINQQNLDVDIKGVLATAGNDFDQLIIYHEVSKQQVATKIYNRDLSISDVCGNAFRCMMLLFYRLYKVRELNIITEKHNNYQCKYIDEQNIAVIFTPPKFSNNEIPLQNDIVNFSLAGLNGNNLFALNVGNPHLIIKYEEKLDAIKLEEISLQISQSEFFPEGININWLNIKSKDHIQILTYERGVGFTNACGSGAIASAIYAYLIHGFGPEILVSMPGGDLKVIWTGYEHPPILIGAAEIEEFK